MSVHGTPLRDEMGINEGGGMTAEEVMTAARNSRANKKRAAAANKRLQKGLSSLPQATNEYGLVKPELPPDVDEEALLKGVSAPFFCSLQHSDRRE